MSEQRSLLNQAERLSEEGRLLWLVGRSLGRIATGIDEPIGPWALKELEKFKEDKPNEVKSHRRQRTQVKGRVKVTPGRLVVVWIASVSQAGQWRSVAVGVDSAGHKQILSLQDGATLNPVICQAMVADLAGHGLPGDGAVLFVTDCSTVLEDTMRFSWDQMPVVAHCQSSVLKGVRGHLQGEKRRQVDERLRRLWQLEAVEAGTKIQALVEELDRDHPGAAERLNRSYKATLVVDRLGVSSPLKEHLVVAGSARMALQKAREWGQGRGGLKAGLTVWLERTRRLQGYKALPGLAESLRKLVNDNSKRKEAASHALESKDAAHQ